MDRNDNSSPDYLSWKGKARPDAKATFPWHPAAYHCLDVAAVGGALLGAASVARRRWAALLGVPEDECISLILLTLALHDLGKFTGVFQAKLTNGSELPGGVVFGRDPGHDVAGGILYDHAPAIGNWRAARFGPPRRVLTKSRPSLADERFRRLLWAAFGHHGSPRSMIGEELGRLATPVDQAAAAGFLNDLESLDGFAVLGPSSLPWLDESRIAAASWALAGLTVLCDWIGSNTRWFPYHVPTLPLDIYWKTVAHRQADLAIREAGLIPARPAGRFSIAEALPGIAAPTPSPMQHWAQTEALPEGPVLAILEDLTGAGKTEAALLLAARIMREKGAQGLYLALPTMATANALYDRLGPVVRALFVGEDQPSLVLAHSARDLHPGFRVVDLEGPNPAESGRVGDQRDESAEVTCPAWIADDRRRTFLADIGVGTIDQALLAVLQTKFQSLRLDGLSRSVLVVDEVHAYDAYMTEAIEALLLAQASLGGSAILLSATLPEATRRRFEAAFTGRPAGGDDSSAYPLATLVSATGAVHAPIAAGRGSRRRLPVRFLADADAAQTLCRKAVARGAAVAWIRNSVDDALDAVEALRDLGPACSLDLFHARFCLGHRLAIEQRVVRRYGRTGGPDRRGIVIATQVIEQSLDLDFDVLISDLAPIDLLIQRAGRLGRHQRGPRPFDLCLHVVGPSAIDDPGPGWFSVPFPRAAFVYRDHGALWLTRRLLEERGAIDLPADARVLIEAVHGPAAEDRIPQALRPTHDRIVGEAGAHRAYAQMALIDLKNGYAPTGHGWEDDARISTRLGEASMAVRLAVWDGESLVPMVTESDPHRAWRLSEVSVPLRRLDLDRAPGPDLVAAERDLAERLHWPEWAPPIVAFRHDGDGFKSCDRSGHIRVAPWTYDFSTGLRYPR